MPSLREIRRKIKSVKSTQQITKAMKMVAAVRLRRAQARILSARPFAQKMEELMADLLSKIHSEYAHPFFERRTGTRRALLLVTSDKGLCGAFNANLIREALKYLQKYGPGNVDLYVVGRKGRDYFRRAGVHITKDWVNIANNLGFVHAEVITRDLLEAYDGGSSGHQVTGSSGHPIAGSTGRLLTRLPDQSVTQSPVVAVDMLYNEFKSVIEQRLVLKTLLPLSPAEGIHEPAWPDFIYEPSKERLLEAVIQRFLKAQVFRVLLESAAAELGARLAAMDNATRNASELIDSLTLRLNRTRQESITKEILEVVSGAEALK
jgi:F-type H+-transporting ATPase subunit gamma